MPGSFITNDLEDMLLTSEFASSATYNGTAISVILDTEYLTVTDAGGTVGFESATPVVYAREVDVSTATQGDRVHVGSQRYAVDQVEPDGTGMVLLRLTSTVSDVDWGSVAGPVLQSLDWGSVADSADASEDWGSVA